MTLKKLKKLNWSEDYDCEVFPKITIFNKEQLIKYFLYLTQILSRKLTDIFDSENH